jgi:hypothetical protein
MLWDLTMTPIVKLLLNLSGSLLSQQVTIIPSLYGRVSAQLISVQTFVSLISLFLSFFLQLMLQDSLSRSF